MLKQLQTLVDQLDISSIPTFHLVLEALMVLAIVKLLFFSKRYKLDDKSQRLSVKEEEELIKEWVPAPLMDEKVKSVPFNPPVVEGPLAAHIKIGGKDKLNLGTFNFLGLIGDKAIEQSAIKTIEKYGVGSCGPRGFYGTVDVHLTLEDVLKTFLNVQEVIVYSYGFSTIASVIPAYSKREDIIFCDEGVSFATQRGLIASRSDVRMFKHNDMEDLENLLIKQEIDDKKNPQKAVSLRRFIVVEGLYVNYGDLAPLKKLVELKFRYKVRLIVEESFSFGVLGATGRGLTEHTGVPVEDVDVLVGSMETSLGSIGGFAAGRSYVIDHQRLSGQGYCFSASLPPFLAVAAIEGVKALSSSSDSLKTLQTNIKTFRQALDKVPGLTVNGDACSPVIHLRLPATTTLTPEQQDVVLQRVVDAALDKGVALTRAAYVRGEEMKAPQPSIRLTVSSKHTADELKAAAETIKQIAKTELKA